MSTPTTIQSNQVPFAVSTDNVTYKNLVCKRAWNFNGDTPVNQEETDCGVHTGLGANTWSVDVEFVINTTPNGATEMSWAGFNTLWLNNTLSYVKMQYSSGTQLYIQGQGYFTNLQVQNQVGNLITVTATFTGDGAPDFSV